jgi:hypothetical protein
MGKYKVPVQPFLFFMGLAVLVWGILGWFLPFGDTSSNIFYMIMGALLMWIGFGWAEGVAHDALTWIGLFFLVIGAVGFVVSPLWVLDLDTVDNVINLLVGVLLFLGGRRILTEDPYLPARRFRI